eukprot:c24329_g1_i1 orf=335-1570(-)
MLICAHNNRLTCHFMLCGGRVAPILEAPQACMLALFVDYRVSAFMDYEFIDETKPRLQLQSRALSVHAEKREIHRFLVVICSGVAVLLLCYSWFLMDLPQFFLIWLALSLLLGPFAPVSLTGGDCRVGVGDLVSEEEHKMGSAMVEMENRTTKQSSHTKRRENVEIVGPSDNDMIVMPQDVAALDRKQRSAVDVDLPENLVRLSNGSALTSNRSESEEERWTAEDIEVLRKQMARHSQGKLRRWELITEAFNGRHTLGNVIKMAKDLGKKKTGKDDSFSKFLADRKGFDSPINSLLGQRWNAENSDGLFRIGESQEDDYGELVRSSGSFSSSNGHALEKSVTKKGDWTEAEDKILVTALKTFPKDTTLRWDKIALVVQGRTKAQCFRRFAELRENFRNAKTDKSGTVVEVD